MASDNNLSSINSVLNLTALQRLDNSITSIVESASQVCVYRYLHEVDEWKKTEVEGTLFVFMRSKKPQHGFIVMNRINTTNLIESITCDFEYQVQKPFILYRNDQGNIHSIWFYQEDNLLKIGKVLSGLTRLTVTKKDNLFSAKTTVSSGDEKKQKKETKNLVNMDIMSLLTRAQEEYDKKLSVQSPSKLRNNDCSSGKIVKPTPLRATNGVVNMSDNASVPLTIDSLFAQVGDGKHVFNGETNRNDKLSRSKSLSEAGRALKHENNEGILQLLLSQSNLNKKNVENGIKIPPGKTVRARSATISNCTDQQTSVEMVEKDLKEKLNILPKCDPTLGDTVKSLTDSLLSYTPSKPRKISDVDDVLTPAMLSSSLPNSYSSPFKLQQCISENEDNYSVSQSSLPKPPLLKKYSPNPLFSPMDFTNSVPSSRLNVNASPPKLNHSPKSKKSFNIDDSLTEEILLPQSLVQSSTPLSLSKPMNVTPLTKAQLREALIYMCQHDDEFINQLHECYLKSLKCQLNHFKSS